MLAIGCAIFIIVTLFGPSRKQDNTYLNLLLAEKDARLKDEQAFRLSETQRADKELANSRSKDSLLQLRSKTNTIRYERVPVIVNAIPHSELSGAIESEFGQ